MIDEEIKRLVGEIDLHRLQKKMTQEGYGPVTVAIGDLIISKSNKGFPFIYL